MATQHNCVTHIIKSDLHSYNSTCQYHQTMAKQFFIKFCIKILVKLIANTEKFYIFVLVNHSGFYLYFID